jgi:hypothetical protein
MYWLWQMIRSNYWLHGQHFHNNPERPYGWE